MRTAVALLAGATAPSWEQVHAEAPGTFEPASGTSGHDRAEFTRITLAGFADRPLPDGKTGAEAGTRMGNEGEAGVTFAGDAQAVQMIAVRKFYASTDVAGVLGAQLQAGDRLAGVDGDCTMGALGPDQPQEYWLQLEGGDVPLLVTASLVDAGKSGPGYTDLIFTRGESGTPVPDCRS